MYEPSEPQYDYAESKATVKSTVSDELSRAVARLRKEIDVLSERLSPVLSEPTPSTSEYPRDVGPHTSSVGRGVAELHVIADALAHLGHRVEI